MRVYAGDGTYLGSTTTTLLVVGLEPTNISVASSPNPVGMNQQTDFTIILTSGGSGSSGLEGKKISISYGDSNGDSTSTSSGGEAQFTHSYASDDTYNAIVTFAGAPLHICILNLYGTMQIRSCPLGA